MKCIGFGEKEGTCQNMAGTKWSPYWCAECNEKRMEHIDRQFKIILHDMRARSTGRGEG